MRTGSGLTGAALPLAGATIAFSLGYPAAGVSLLGATGLVVAGTFAPRLPLLHRLPVLGAHQLNFKFSLDGRDDLVLKGGATGNQNGVVRIGISHNHREDLKDATVNLLVPETVDLAAVKANEEPSQLGELMPPTTESLRQRADGTSMWSNYWAASGLSVPGRVPTLLHFRLSFKEPGLYPIRAKLVAQNLYTAAVADTRIRVEKSSSATKLPDKGPSKSKVQPHASKPAKPVPPPPSSGESLKEGIVRELAFGKQLRDGLPTQTAPNVLMGILWAGRDDLQGWIERVAFLFAEHGREDLRSSFLRASPPRAYGVAEVHRTLAESLSEAVRGSGPSQRKHVEAKLARLDQIRRDLQP